MTSMMEPTVEVVQLPVRHLRHELRLPDESDDVIGYWRARAA